MINDRDRRGHWSRSGRRWHRMLAWPGALALILFVLSGLTHPLMTWFGPQPATPFPPQANFAAEDVGTLPRILEAQGLREAQAVRLVPSPRGSLWQFTPATDGPRRYFQPASGKEVLDHDRRQAVWLARHFTAQQETAVSDVALQTRFDHAYPEVNRLLPVWRVRFAGDEGLTAWVDTELGQLAALGNDLRSAQQGVFRLLHTFSWLDGQETLRVAVLLGLLAALLAITLAGLVVLLQPSRATRRPPGRLWHRRLGILLCLPLLAFSISGTYHLLHTSGAPARESAQSPAMSLQALWQLPALSAEQLAPLHLAHGPLNSVTLLSGPDDSLFLRGSRPAGRAGAHVHQRERFAGKALDGGGKLLQLTGPAIEPLNDRSLAQHFARRYLGTEHADLSADWLTHFTGDYDFRNKRLPVWQLQHGETLLFVDPATGTLVDRASPADRLEGSIFSQLHKWNFLVPMAGREGRDMLVVAVLGTSVGLMMLGLGMARRAREKRPRTSAQPQPS